jgi:hypothetical protein
MNIFAASSPALLALSPERTNCEISAASKKRFPSDPMSHWNYFQKDFHEWSWRNIDAACVLFPNTAAMKCPGLNPSVFLWS